MIQIILTKKASLSVFLKKSTSYQFVYLVIVLCIL